MADAPPTGARRRAVTVEGAPGGVTAVAGGARPECVVRPVEHQVDDLLAECRDCRERGLRVLVTTLTKRMAEDLTDYLQQMGVRVRYMHSDIDAIERMEIVRGLRLGEFDVLVGINLLREGLDLPEVSLVAILDADQEGFLRSDRSLIQTVGRAARHVGGRAIFYADRMTGSMERCIQETTRRRETQRLHNEANGIVPRGVEKSVDQVRFITINDYGGRVEHTIRLGSTGG